MANFLKHQQLPGRDNSTSGYAFATLAPEKNNTFILNIYLHTHNNSVY